MTGCVTGYPSSRAPYDFATVKYVLLPRLSITRALANAVMDSWPLPFADYSLHRNDGLRTTNWLAALTPPLTNAESKYILVDPPLGQRFYRLKEP